MKSSKKKWNLFISFMAVFCTIIACIEGLIYYSSYTAKGHLLLAIALTLENCIKTFVFSPTIKFSDVAKNLSEGSSLTLNDIWIYLYCLSVLLMQCVTATAIISLLKKFFASVILRFRLAFSHTQKHVVIFGYNEDVKTLIKNEAKNKREKTYIHLYIKGTVSDDDQLFFAKNHVFLHDMMDDASAIKSACNRIMKNKKTEKILLMMESEISNANIYMNLCTAWKERHPSTSDDEKKKPVCYAFCEDDSIRQLMESYADSKKTGPALDCIFVTVPEIAVNDMFKAHPLQQIFRSQFADKDLPDVHLLIAGFGKLGQEVLRYGFLNGPLNQTQSIVIDVLDRSATKKARLLLSRLHKDSYEQLDASSEYYSSDWETYKILPEHADGELILRFADVELTSTDAQRILGQLDAIKPFTYSTICLENPDSSIHTMTLLVGYLQKQDSYKGDKQPVTMVRMDTDQDMLNFINNEDKGEYKKVFPVKARKLLLTIAEICNEETEDFAKKYHYFYKIEAASLADEGTIPEWAKLSSVKRNSNRYAARYYNQVRNSKKALPTSSPEYEESEFLDQAGATEQRRWCYGQAWLGFTYGPTDPDSKTHSCLVTWDTLKESPDTKDFVKYNMIPVHIINRF